MLMGTLKETLVLYKMIMLDFIGMRSIRVTIKKDILPLSILSRPSFLMMSPWLPGVLIIHTGV